ncbi:hypothetical protein XBJ1_2117 [Xenorhabdus bovienii SS-2004]|uniref:Uncharacterized protein n=1 Tax=Xenorhabdus bovienii (strain SS-2004) TaxID=406818 RepID=D3V3C8_XENBS|nr:hypothetical protein [Xenorhabdus bovienii]CBJ81243.1 hypothetical protein XBJ1_2117 [Xenorhabdus bovienii SS-2004]
MGWYRHYFNDIYKLPLQDAVKDSVKLVVSNDKQYHYFLDIPKYQPGPRLNIFGHGDPNRASFQGHSVEHPLSGTEIAGFPCREKLPDAHPLSPSDLAESIKPLILLYHIRSIRLVACYTGRTGFARDLSQFTGLPVKAPIHHVDVMEFVTTGCYWIIKRQEESEEAERNFRWFGSHQ